MSIRLRLLPLVLAVAVSGGLGGCAYYNLFYNAEKAFEEGEELGKEIDPRDWPSSSQKGKYQTAIRKCKLALEEYPDSGYVDDALFLMGKSHFRLREWSDAIRNFDNVLANFPKSPFVEETMYLKSLAHLSRGEEAVGLEWFARLRESYPRGEFGIEATYRLGDAYAENERYDEAIRYYGEYLERYPDHEDRGRVILAQARMLFESERFPEVVETVGLADLDDLTKSQAFEVEWLRLSALNQSGRSEEAQAGLEVLEEKADLPEERAKMLLLTGEIQLARGQQEEGTFTLNSLGQQFKGTAFEAQAYATLLEYALKTEGPDSEAAKDALARATEKRMSGEYAEKIRERQQQLQRYANLREAVDESDSTSAGAKLKLAEMTLVDFDRPEDALALYQRLLEEHPDDPRGARAAYAIGFIQSSRLGNPEAAEVAHALLRERYPESPQARSLDGEVFLEARPRSRTPEADGDRDRRGDRSGGVDAGVTGGAGVEGRTGRPLRYGGPGASLPREGRPR